MDYTHFKQIIDNSRDILMGKLPSPIAQVDAISYALIYKFMSDTDDDSAALGGKRTYFSGEYEKYSWHNLMSPTITGADRVILYRNALENMSRNPNIPPLFREIFNGATLGFTDSNTLNLFLREIDKIKQSSGDSIGDAYEYLLSTMGSQGKLGQFRTPRHIINMMVELIDPDKSDKILDPACGTAGFLISAYNWIKKKHIEKERLNSEDIEKIHRNFYGFDIEPNMTRIARVNLFLHGFKSPHIIEHDTLSSEDYWDDRYDVIIANPPFMTPKGGITPHKKFGITSNRAELLFVDYIASHLKPNGRAAVIVPDGVLFGSSTAHKSLRKEIIENKKLQAVISMPSGVFKPYAGVSTAILVFTNSNSERTDKVWFYDMKTDGYSLDDKRSKLKTSDIPDILARFKNLDGEKDRARNEQSFFVDKEEIVKNGYDLTINKYKEVEYEQVEYPPTSEIIAEIKKLDKEASENLAELEKLLNETNPDL